MQRLTRGLYLAPDAINAEGRPWEMRAEVTTARCLALTELLSASNPPVFTMEAALTLHGLQGWRSTPDIAFWRTFGVAGQGAQTLPAVRLHAVHVPAVQYRQLRGSRLLTGSQERRGLRVVSLEELAVDLARFAHPLVAWVGVTSVLREMTRFDTFRLSQSREREGQAKFALLRMLAPVQGNPGSRRAETILALADSSASGPAEAAFLWLLQILLRGDTAGDYPFEAQHEVIVEGRQFFLDVGFPRQKVACEFDGAGKMIDGPLAAAHWIERQHLLQRAGWRFIRLGMKDLAHFPSMARTVAQGLSQHGIRTQSPGGPLWRVPTSDLMDRARRH